VSQYIKSDIGTDPINKKKGAIARFSR